MEQLKGEDRKEWQLKYRGCAEDPVGIYGDMIYYQTYFT